ncbi:MAG: siphovirus ReqiPepy6 Gp37-like family protein [Oscillospiraceae bacterium]|nr:siphovirus ReqiPepy6 Gp37-like family protein [Oscillospiraceae bacterium]
MELYIYDNALNLQGVVEKITSLLWIRRYWAAGEFKLLAPATPQNIELLKMRRLVMLRGGDEAGEIRWLTLRKTLQGEELIEVQGRFLPCWLGKRVVLDPIMITAPTPAIMQRIVRENVTAPRNPLRRIPNISLGNVAIERGNIDYQSEPYINALLALQRLGQASKLGFALTADVRVKQFSFTIYDGRNLTAGQVENPPAVFAVEFDNVLEQQFTHSTERLRSTAFVGGEDLPDHPRTVVETGDLQAAGLARAEVFIDAHDIAQRRWDSTGNFEFLPEEQYRALLKQRGAQQLELFAENITFSSRINPNANLRYRHDFDLGDRVTCLDRRWGLQIHVRITEVTEVYQDSAQPQIEVTFGESQPTLADQIRLAQ